MDAQKVDMFIMTHGKYFSGEMLPFIREKLLSLDDSKFIYVQAISFKDPTIMLVVSLLAGGLGVDRFMLGDVGLGVAKLLTCGGAGIWTIVDWFTIMGKARETNLKKFNEVLMMSA